MQVVFQRTKIVAWNPIMLNQRIMVELYMEEEAAEKALPRERILRGHYHWSDEQHGADGWETEIRRQWMAEVEQQSYPHHEYEYHFFASFFALLLFFEVADYTIPHHKQILIISSSIQWWERPLNIREWNKIATELHFLEARSRHEPRCKVETCKDRNFVNQSKVRSHRILLELPGYWEDLRQCQFQRFLFHDSSLLPRHLFLQATGVSVKRLQRSLHREEPSFLPLS